MSKRFMPFLLLDGNDGNGGGPSGAGKGDGPKTWEEYVASLPEDQKSVVTSLYEAQNSALLKTVKATRQERDTFADQLRDAAKKLEKGSEAQTQLLEHVAALEEANRRADFYEAAPFQECKNPKAAYAIAKASNLFVKATGLPDWKAIKEEAPELFGPVTKPKGKGAAGAGTDDKPRGTTINQFIRAKAGLMSE